MAPKYTGPGNRSLNESVHIGRQMRQLERPLSKQSIPKHCLDSENNTLLPLVKVRLPHGKSLYLDKETGAYIIATEPWHEEITDAFLGTLKIDQQALSDDRTTAWIDLLAQANLLYRAQLPENQLCFGPLKVHLLIVELTETCNLACDYCYSSAGGKDTISIETVQRAAELFFGSHYCAHQLHIHFSGGEPLARFSHLLATIDCMKDVVARGDSEVSFTLQTNGTLLTPNKAQALAKRGVAIGVTIETFDEKAPAHRHYTNGRSSVVAAMRGLRMAKRFGILSRVNITITDQNVHTLPDVVSRLLREDFQPSLVQFLPVFIGKGGLSTFQALKPDIHSLTVAAQESLKILTDFNRHHPDNRVYELSTVAMMRKMFYERYIPEMCDQSPCGAGRQMLSLDMYGNIYPCDGFNRHQIFRCGNVIVDDIDTIMSAVPIRYVQQRNVLAIQACNMCKWKAYCNAGCPHDIPTNESYSSFGQLFAKSYLCEYYESMILFIFDVIAEGLDPSLLMPTGTELDILG